MSVARVRRLAAALRRAYPNYFLDTNKFLTAMRTAMGEKSALN